MGFLGFDYSLRHPAAAYVWSGGIKILAACEGTKHWGKKRVPEPFDVRVKPIGLWKTTQQRYDVIASPFVDFFKECQWLEPIECVGIEGYALGARGRVFHIAENTQCLKGKLFALGFEPVVYTPNQVKFFATGKGNSSKEEMAQGFFDKYGFWMHEALELTDPGMEPSTGLVDATFVAELTKNSKGEGGRF